MVALEEPENEYIEKKINNNDNSLLNGEFDEEKSHKYFLEALNAYRDNNKKSSLLQNKENKKEKNEKTVKFNEEISTKDLKSNKNKGCWNCFKFINEKEIIVIFDKNFCSLNCSNTYLEIFQISCENNNCNKKFLKENGINRRGKWFCNEECNIFKSETNKKLLEYLENNKNYNGFNLENNKNSKELKSKNENESNTEESNWFQEVDLDLNEENIKIIPTLFELEAKYANSLPKKKVFQPKKSKITKKNVNTINLDDSLE